MADGRVQLEAEDWVRREWMKTKFNLEFSRERLPLEAGGQFDFDAVSLDRTIAANISTNGGKTARGRAAMPKLNKIRSDILFLMMAQVQRRMVMMTDRDMFELCQDERRKGRLPKSIEMFHAEVPPELESRLKDARRIAAEEVTRQ